jgi:hypothetical protein
VVRFNAGALIVIDNAAVAETEALSVTLRVKLDDAAVVGVPEIVLPEILKPAGSCPVATDHVYGGVPPVALSGCDYAMPTVPGGREDVVRFKAGALIVIDNAAVAETEALSVTLTVKLEGPAIVGVPEIVLPDRLKPAGRDPLAIDHVYGGVPPVALSVCEYATPTVPGPNDEVVMTRGGTIGAGSIVMDRDLEAVPVLLSVTCTVNVAVPAAAGVPLITPVVEERLRP